MITGEVVSQGGEAARGQVFFDRKMGKLHDSTPADVDHRDETGTCRLHNFFCVFGAPTHVEVRRCVYVEPDGENFCQLLDRERPDGDRETLEDTVSVFLFLLVDPE